ncbi:MAG: hypothetical protein AB7T86_17000 [Xanthobacteraceae bacterium]|uniref:hypothetical protein n=1 Tax=Pseudolabrys sp. TaxID=1960880 RepID=UPI003D131536
MFTKILMSASIFCVMAAGPAYAERFTVSVKKNGKQSWGMGASDRRGGGCGMNGRVEPFRVCGRTFYACSKHIGRLSREMRGGHVEVRSVDRRGFPRVC